MTLPSGVHVFEPRHVVKIKYPVPVSTENHNTELEVRLHLVGNSGNRYEPGRLINDVAVHNHASRANKAESSIVSSTNAPFTFSPLHLLLSAETNGSTDGGLLPHMMSITKRIGKTNP